MGFCQLSDQPVDSELAAPRTERVRAQSRARVVVLVIGIVVLVTLAVFKPWASEPPRAAVVPAQSQATAVAATPVPASLIPVATDELLDTWIVQSRPAGASAAAVVAVLPPSGNERHARIVGLDPASGAVKWSLSCTSGCGPRGSLAASPGGDEIAYTVSDGRADSIRAVDLRTGVVRSIADCGGCDADAVQLSWSSDGATIAVDSGASGIWTVLANPGPLNSANRGAHLLSIDGRDASFSPDGTLLMFVNRSLGITIVEAQGGAGSSSLPFRDVFWAAWSPDGTRVAYVVDPRDPSYQGGGDPLVAQLWVADLDGTHRSLLHEIPRCCIGAWVVPPAWSRDGRSLAWLDPLPPSDAPDELVLVDRDGSHAVEWRIGLEAVTPTWTGDGSSS
jgi:hypothetical protein